MLYDVYESVLNHSPDATVVIPPPKNAVLDDNNHTIRNKNLSEIIEQGRMHWQKANQYGRRNYSELGIQRYKRILGNTMQSREMARQKRKRRYLGRYFAHPMMQNRRAKRDDYKPSAVRVTQRCVP
ncbi:hypothetical protein PsalN5692_03796 (plasmid) [Piscirickettsia salmonis]|uniref:hypothetical protein n=1 Tax=Piscirickettsia salmonis TaxID=1238 RepID=UPI001E3F85E7|nr:hypothetical protein [Piscirickettsia salmonis]QGP52288.1 hypothetical protein PsalN5692_03796 [Piscirickettsia salmonis]